jgi:large subunit ribosomal protein L4
MKVAVLNTSGAETGRSVELNDSIFGIEPNDHAIYLDVKQYLANQRQGTHSAKEKSQLSGSTKKLKNQKGTGGARAGSIKNPLYRGGARVFGPRPRDYSFKLNKKVKELARKSILSYKAKENLITVIEDFKFEVPKTQKMIEIQSNLKLNDKKVLLILPEPNKSIYLSSRNLQGITVLTASDINTYQMTKAKNLVIFESSVGEIEKVLNK